MAADPAHTIYVTLEGSQKRFASLGRTAQGMQLCLYPSGATGEGWNHQVGYIAQGKRFLERWLAHRESEVRRTCALSRQSGWNDRRCLALGSEKTCE
jgi:hypothetical protein